MTEASERQSSVSGQDVLHEHVLLSSFCCQIGNSRSGWRTPQAIWQDSQEQILPEFAFCLP